MNFSRSNDGLVFIFVLLVIGLMPWEAFTVETGVSITRIAFIGMVGAAISTSSISLIPKGSPLVIIYATFLFWCLLSIFWSRFPDVTIDRVLILLQYFIIFVVYNNTVKNKDRLLAFLGSYIVGCLFLSAFSIYEYLSIGLVKSANKLYRTMEYGNPNENAFMIVYSIVIVLNIFKLVRINNKFKSAVLLIHITVSSIAIIFTGSRNGFIMLIVTGTIYLLSSFKGTMSYGKILIISSAVVLGGYSFFTLLEEPLQERLLNISENLSQKNLGDRQDIWKAALGKINDPNFNVFLGSGWGTFQDEQLILVGRYQGAHNFYLNILYTTGIVGALIVLAYFIYLIKTIYGTHVSIRYEAILLLLIPMISMMSTNWESRKWWFVLGLIITKIADYDQMKNTVKTYAK